MQVNKNIGILTHPLHSNYGGILQAYALKSFLITLTSGEVFILDKKIENPHFGKNLFVKMMQRLPFQNIFNIRNSYKQRRNHRNFIKDNFNIKNVGFSEKSLCKVIKNNDIKTVVVGSDQVWRYAYIKNWRPLDFFLSNVRGVNKISYAASFGVSFWEKPELVNNIKNLLADFNAISVRERSGVQLCKEQFAIDNVKHVLDPTLLFDQDFYLKLIEKKIKKDKKIAGQKENYIFQYILDGDHENFYENSHDLSVKKVGLESSVSIEEWLFLISNSSFVLTDSFHGMVFSIIFKKQFIVYLNKNRGSDRFESLLKLLGIESRIYSGEKIEDEINYQEVYNKLKFLRKESSDFLKENIRV